MGILQNRYFEKMRILEEMGILKKMGSLKKWDFGKTM